MDKIGIEKDIAISDLKKLFKIGNNNSMHNDNSFLIHKSDYERFEVINLLSEYFNDKYIIDGCLEIGRITLVYTILKIISQ